LQRLHVKLSRSTLEKTLLLKKSKLYMLMQAILYIFKLAFTPLASINNRKSNHEVGLFRLSINPVDSFLGAPSMGAIYRVKVPNGEGSKYLQSEKLK